jgi:hypothetical protein
MGETHTRFWKVVERRVRGSKRFGIGRSYAVG